MSAILRALTLAFAIAVVSVAFAQDKKADATGTWKWTVAGRDGQNFEQSAKLKQDGEKLTGTVTGRQGAETGIEAGKVTGSELSFTVTREFNGNKFVSKHAGKIDGDVIKGTIEFDRGGEVQKREWEAKRDKPAPAPPAPQPEVKPVMAPGKATGSWRYVFKRDDGTEMVSLLRLKQDGEKLTGVNVWNNGPEVAIEDGSVKNDTVAFTVTRERDGNKIVVKYSGKLETDKITGTATAAFGGEERTFDLAYEKFKE